MTANGFDLIQLILPAEKVSALPQAQGLVLRFIILSQRPSSFRP
jgi:hypothetical protein